MTGDRVGDYCENTVRGTIDLIGGKWSMPILWEIRRDEHRYAELHRRVVGISQKVLSAELKRLVGAGLVEREVVAAIPPQVTYRITAEGRSLDEVFEGLHEWGHGRPLSTTGRTSDDRQ